MRNRISIITGLLLLNSCIIKAKISYDLQTFIHMAQDSSAEAIKARNVFNEAYWQYRNYKAERLPSLTMTLTPLQYDRNVIKRYISETDRDEYRSQRSLYTYGNLQFSQNIDLTGGTVYASSELGLLRTFSTSTYNQFTSAPFRIGYQQSLIGYNGFKWDHKIEPVKYEVARRNYAYEKEGIVYQTATLFFEVASAKTRLKITRDLYAKADTLFLIGKTQYEQDALIKSDLLTLEQNRLQLQNQCVKNENDYQNALFNLLSYVGFSHIENIEIVLPDEPPVMVISYDQAIAECRCNNPAYLDMQQNIMSAAKDLDKAKKQRHLEANLDLSIGYNQYSDHFREAFRNLMQQEVISIGVTIPLIDWGLRKGKYNMAKSSLETTQAEEKKKILEVEQEVFVAVNNYHTQQNFLKNARSGIDVNNMIYKETIEKFKTGTVNVKDVKEAMSNVMQSETTFIESLRDDWLSYFNLRRLTLYDFQKGCQLVHAEEQEE